MSQLPPVNDTCWESGRSHFSNLSVSDIASFDEEKLDEILPAEFTCGQSAFATVHSETHEDSESNTNNDEPEPMDATFSTSSLVPSIMYHSMGNDINDQINPSESLLMNSFSFPNLADSSHDRNEPDTANTNFTKSSSLHEANILDENSCITSHHNNAMTTNPCDSSYPPLSTVDLQGQEMDLLTDLDTVSTSHSVSSSLDTDTMKEKLPFLDVGECGGSSSCTADGRWTPEEHEAFLQGLQQHGREWKKVAQNIPTRTSSQIRSHAQKYFAKLAREEQQRALSLNRSLVSSEAVVQISSLSTSSSQLSVPHVQQPLTPSAQGWLERILVDPEAVQREVEEQLGRLRARYRELQIAMEQRQANENGRMRMPRPQNESVHRRDSSSSRESSSPNTLRDVTGRATDADAYEIIPDFQNPSDEGTNASSVARSNLYPQDETLHIARTENPSMFHHQLRNSMAVLRRKRLCSERTIASSLTRTLDSSRAMDVEYTSSYPVPSPSTSSVGRRALGNEELIALEVLGGDLRRNTSIENLTLSTTHDSLDSTWNNPNSMEEEDTQPSISYDTEKLKDDDSSDSRDSKKCRWNKDDESDCPRAAK